MKRHLSVALIFTCFSMPAFTEVTASVGSGATYDNRAVQQLSPQIDLTLVGDHSWVPLERLGLPGAKPFTHAMTELAGVEVVLGPVSGAVIDRLGPRSTLAVAKVIGVVASLALLAADDFRTLALLSALHGVSMALSLPALQSMPPRLVDRHGRPVGYDPTIRHGLAGHAARPSRNVGSARSASAALRCSTPRVPSWPARAAMVRASRRTPPRPRPVSRPGRRGGRVGGGARGRDPHARAPPRGDRRARAQPGRGGARGELRRDRARVEGSRVVRVRAPS